MLTKTDRRENEPSSLSLSMGFVLQRDNTTVQSPSVSFKVGFKRPRVKDAEKTHTD